MRIEFTSWWSARKRVQSVFNTLSRIDSFNDTTYSKQKTVDANILEEASKFAHENSRVYYATIYNGDTPVNFLEINKDFYRVGFLDEHLRTYLSYDFQGSNNGKLFLSKATYFEFQGDTDKKAKITNYLFKEDGSLTIIETDSITREQVIQEAKNKIDVSGNYEDYPKFGKYEALIKKERLTL